MAAGYDERIAGPRRLSVELAGALEHEQYGEAPGRLGALVDVEELPRLLRRGVPFGGISYRISPG